MYLVYMHTTNTLVIELHVPYMYATPVP